jgi:hypothetical protein
MDSKPRLGESITTPLTMSCTDGMKYREHCNPLPVQIDTYCQGYGALVAGPFGDPKATVASAVIAFALPLTNDELPHHQHSTSFHHTSNEDVNVLIAQQRRRLRRPRPLLLLILNPSSVQRPRELRFQIDQPSSRRCRVRFSGNNDSDSHSKRNPELRSSCRCLAPHQTTSRCRPDGSLVLRRALLWRLIVALRGRLAPYRDFASSQASCSPRPSQTVASRVRRT